VDPDRVAIYGASYGGYAALAGAAFTPELYRCGIAIANDGDLFNLFERIPPYWKAMLEPTYKMIGHPKKDSARLRAVSPRYHTDQIECPLLIITGQNDPIVKKEEVDELVQALEADQVPHRYTVLEGEGHGLTKQENRIQLNRAIISFLTKHLPPAQPPQSEAKE
jgi:dipeptidyl aminopeptidase/acylaminoacyl peptidase